MAMDGPAEWAPDGNVTCHLFTCVMVKSTNGDVMGTKSDTRPMHNLPTVATTARIHRSACGRGQMRQGLVVCVVGRPEFRARDAGRSSSVARCSPPSQGRSRVTGGGRRR